MRRRIARSVARSAPSRRVPSSVTLPAAIGCSASSAMPSVVLPDPDSPTMPSVSPRFNSSVASRTARKTSLPNQPFADTKSTSTSRAAARTGASAATGTTARCGRLLISLTVYGSRGRPNTSGIVPCSTSRPRSITPTRWPNRRTRLRSCVMNRIAIPYSACRSSSSARIWTWIVTSSAVVGSSAISSFGRHASAIAIIARCRWPPDSWCGYASTFFPGSGMPVR